MEILAAITGHDDLAKEWEGDQLNEAGAPRDFRQSSGGKPSFEPLNELIETSLYRGRMGGNADFNATCAFCRRQRPWTEPAAKAFNRVAGEASATMAKGTQSKPKKWPIKPMRSCSGAIGCR